LKKQAKGPVKLPFVYSILVLKDSNFVDCLNGTEAMDLKIHAEMHVEAANSWISLVCWRYLGFKQKPSLLFIKLSTVNNVKPAEHFGWALLFQHYRHLLNC
jgi:hypothetical protein